MTEDANRMETRGEDIGRENRVVQIGEHYLITDKSALRLGKRELKILPTEA